MSQADSALGPQLSDVGHSTHAIKITVSRTSGSMTHRERELQGHWGLFCNVDMQDGKIARTQDQTNNKQMSVDPMQ